MKILIAVDNEPNGMELAQYVTDHFSDTGSEIMVLHAVEPFASYSYLAGLPLPLFEEMEQDATLAARVLVRHVALKLRDQYRSTKISEKVALGHPPDIIVREALNFGADCIVVGCRQLKGLDKLIVSRVSKAVLDHAECSVLVVKNQSAHKEAITKCKPEEAAQKVTA